MCLMHRYGAAFLGLGDVGNGFEGASEASSGADVGSPLHLGEMVWEVTSVENGVLKQDVWLGHVLVQVLGC